ncbi:MAG: hypothetical protein D6675_01000 [Gemmatimonadetes bacterium]|nr:MAG: hypothetical protein D6675_01000 [Gemmatimonadota bacterium]
MCHKSTVYEIEVTEGCLPLDLSCPNGCSLMDPELTIHDQPAIRLKFEFEGHTGELYLDAIYGRYHSIVDTSIPPQATVTFYCPTCNAVLNHETARCDSCEAPLFTMYLPDGAIHYVCTRYGCHHSYIVSIDGEIEYHFIKKEDTDPTAA